MSIALRLVQEFFEGLPRRCVKIVPEPPAERPIFFLPLLESLTIVPKSVRFDK
jgi:hypothetical protein